MIAGKNSLENKFENGLLLCLALGVFPAPSLIESLQTWIDTSRASSEMPRLSGISFFPCFLYSLSNQILPQDLLHVYGRCTF